MNLREVLPFRCIGIGMYWQGHFSPHGQKTCFFIRAVLCARYVWKMLFAERPVLSATLRQSTKEVSKIRQTRENQSNGQCPSQLSQSLCQKPMRLKQAFALLTALWNMAKYIKETFLSSSRVLFEGLPNKETIKSGMRDIPISARSVEPRIEEMAENVRAPQTAGRKDAVVFSLALTVIRLWERSSVV